MAERADHRGAFGATVVGVFALLAAGVLAWWMLLESPRRAIDARIALVESWGGRVDTVSSCPDWLEPAVRETWIEDYFRWVVGLSVQHNTPLDDESTRYLEAFRNLDYLTLEFNGVDAAPILAHLPKNEDLDEMWLTRSSSLPDPAAVPNLQKLGLGVSSGRSRLAEPDLSRFTRLRTVSLSLASGIERGRTSNVLAALPSARRLERLEIRGHGLSNENWRQLAGLTRIREIVFTLGTHQNQFNEERVRMLAGLPNLRRLEFHLVSLRSQSTWIGELCANDSLQAIDMHFRLGNHLRATTALREQDFARLTVLQDQNFAIDQPNLPPLTFTGSENAKPFDVTLDTRQGRLRLKVRRIRDRPRNG